VPFLAAQDVSVPIGSGRGLDRVDVRARALLGDGVALVPLAPDCRQHPGVELMLGRNLGDPRRRRRHDPRERVGNPADLLGDKNLLKHRESPTTELLRHVHRREAEIDRFPRVLLRKLVGKEAVVHLGRYLMRNQLVGKRTCLCLNGEVLGIQRERVDYFLLVNERTRSKARDSFASLRTTCAALRPGTAITPPPG
jgi:hypothetical protein